MLEVPETSNRDVIFGSVENIPKWEDIPEEFKHHFASPKNHKACEFASAWFFSGLDRSRITAREGVNEFDALKAIKAILNCRKPKHEHKIAACGYLFDQWFEIQ